MTQMSWICIFTSDDPLNVQMTPLSVLSLRWPPERPHWHQMTPLSVHIHLTWPPVHLWKLPVLRKVQDPRGTPGSQGDSTGDLYTGGGVRTTLQKKIGLGCEFRVEVANLCSGCNFGLRVKTFWKWVNLKQKLYRIGVVVGQVNTSSRVQPIRVNC